MSEESEEIEERGYITNGRVAWPLDDHTSGMYSDGAYQPPAGWSYTKKVDMAGWNRAGCLILKSRPA